MAPRRNGSPLLATYGSGEVGRGDFKNRGLKAAAAARLTSQVLLAHTTKINSIWP